MKPTLLLLAAGMGSRYGGLKQLDTFGIGEHTLMEYSVFDAKKAGFEIEYTDRVVGRSDDISRESSYSTKIFFI